MSLVDRYRLPITALDASTLREAFLDFLEDAYNGVLDREALTRIESAQVDYTAMGVEAAMRVGERAAGEASLASAVESQNVLDLAFSLYGYVPPGDVSARFTVQFTADTEPTVVFPQGLKLSTGSGTSLQEFELEEEVVKPSGTATVTGVARAGTTKTLVRESDGSAGQIYELEGLSVDTTSVVVTVQGEEWTQVTSFGSSRPFDKHFRIRALEFVPGDRRYQVLFGDGVLGLIPQAGEVIELTFVTGAGRRGNVGLETITRVAEPVYDAFSNRVFVEVSNTASLTRGRDHEHVDIPRLKAPLRRNLRFHIVSKQDYESAALLVGGGAIRAAAYNFEDLGGGWNPNSVLVLVAVDFVDPATDSEAEAIRDAILDTYNQNGTARLVVGSADFEEFDLDINVRLHRGYKVSEVQPVLQALLDEFFGPDSTVGPVPEFVVDIGRPIVLSHLVEALGEVEGVDKVALPTLEAGGFDEIVPAFNKLPIITTNLTVLPADG